MFFSLPLLCLYFPSVLTQSGFSFFIQPCDMLDHSLQNIAADFSALIFPSSFIFQLLFNQSPFIQRQHVRVRISSLWIVGDYSVFIIHLFCKPWNFKSFLLAFQHKFFSLVPTFTTHSQAYENNIAPHHGESCLLTNPNCLIISLHNPDALFFIRSYL